MLQISQNIRWVRLLSGLRQEDFAQKIGCKTGALRTYETGRTVPNELIQQKIAEVAGISVEQLNEVDLKRLNIQVKNPDTGAVEYTLANTSTNHGDGSETKAELERLKEQLIRLETENKLLKEMNDKLLEKR